MNVKININIKSICLYVNKIFYDLFTINKLHKYKLINTILLINYYVTLID